MIRIFILSLSLILAAGPAAGQGGQGNPMTKFDARYGENYQSIAFDGIWDAKDRDVAVMAGGKVYAAWIDRYGDVVVGEMDPDGGTIKSYVVEDDLKQKVGQTLIALSAGPGGELSLHVVSEGKPSVVKNYSFDKGAWGLAAATDCGENIAGIRAAGGGGLFALTAGGRLLQIGAGKMTGSPVELARSVGSFQAAYGAGKTFLAIGNAIYMVAAGDRLVLLGELAPGEEVADLGVDARGDAAVLARSGDGVWYMALASNGATVQKAAKKEKLPLSVLADDIVLGQNAREVYFVGKPGARKEIQKCVKDAKGRWSVEPVTVNTERDNYAVRAIRGAQAGSPQICWLQSTIEDVAVNQLAAVKTDAFQPAVTDIRDRGQILRLMKKVADWQLTASFTANPRNDWQWGAFYLGLIKAYELTGDERYFNELLNIGQYFDWGLMADALHADRVLVGDIYQYVYNKTGRKDPHMLEQFKWMVDLCTSRVAVPNPRFEGAPTFMEWWTWCDALYMAPPVFYNYANLTGDKEAAGYAFRHTLITVDHLYSRADSLFYRDDRFFYKKTTNGKKVFWGRGNGWIMASFPRVLEALPEKSPYRAYYEELYLEMAPRILSLQLPEGLWTCNLLDPEELMLGESSGSVFYGYSLAWGINNGYLDRKIYGPAVERAWEAICGHVSEFGRLGYVQQIAGEPFPFFEYQYHTYASGGFLQFASEMLEYLDKKS